MNNLTLVKEKKEQKVEEGAKQKTLVTYNKPVSIIHLAVDTEYTLVVVDLIIKVFWDFMWVRDIMSKVQNQ